MKQLYWYISLFCLLLSGGICACSSEEDRNIVIEQEKELLTPGDYVVGFNLDADASMIQTRGILEGGAFDTNYEPDVIYLHKKIDSGDDQGLEIPVYNYHCDGAEVECKGFRIKICKKEEGVYTVYPVKEDGTVDETQTKEFTVNDSAYFSSMQSRYWTNGTELVSNEDTKVLGRDENNVEIYRSKINYTLDELAESGGDLTLTRKCSLFEVFGMLIYDGTDKYGYPKHSLEPSDFVELVGDAPSNWYIKVYVGPCFTGNYDMQDGVTADLDYYGFYVSNNNVYQQFDVNLTIGSLSSVGNVTYTGIGYKTESSDILLAPFDVKTEGNLPETRNRMAVYVYMKHWDGEAGTSPTEDWLKSDEDALYVVYRYNGAAADLLENRSYVMGVGISVNDFVAAFKEAGVIGDDVNTTALKRGSWGREPREIKVKTPLVVFDY